MNTTDAARGADAAPGRTAAAPPVSTAARGFYVALAVGIAGIVVLGFWPYFSALPAGGPDVRPILHVHAAVFSGWLAILLAQTVLVFRRRVRAHQRLGTFAIYYGVLLLALGLVVGIAAPVFHVRAGNWPLDAAAGFLIEPLGDMALFAGFFAAGIAFRRRKELHKRLMVLAAVVLVYPAAARAAGAYGFLAVLGLWLLPLALAIAYDAVVRRRVERVYLLGAAVLVVAFGRVLLAGWEPWLRIGRRILLTFIPDSP